MDIGDAGIAMIKKWEGCRLQAYKCPAGVWTIGYGHTYGVKEGDKITQEDADRLLREDMELAIDCVAGNLLEVGVTQNQFDALCSLVHNIGVRAFSYSTLLRKVKANPEDETIRAEFERWVYAGGKVLQGLVNRRKDEANLYFSK